VALLQADPELLSMDDVHLEPERVFERSRRDLFPTR
jgi:hypothetical protein